jgi:hypothetical protein
MANLKTTLNNALDAGKGVLRLFPTWVPRTFCVPGKRMKLHPDDIYAFGAHRGGIDERWFASTVNAYNGPETLPDEGLSYIYFNDGNGEEKILLKDAVDDMGAELLGKHVMDKHGGWLMFAKYFDNMGPLPHHLHQDDDAAEQSMKIRTVLATIDEYSPDIDEMLLQLRHVWKLELNIDPETNVDEGGRNLGRTLWHAMVLVESPDNPEGGAYVSVWATADSLGAMEEMTERTLEAYPEWRFVEIYTIDRVAYDERPDELADLPPRPEASEVLLVAFEPWEAPAETNDRDDAGGIDRG